MTTLRQRRESTDDKARRLLTTGKLRIVHKDSSFIHAECQGDTDHYDLFYKDERWYCSCEARVDCSHLRALWLVTVKL